jgi:2'-5' RNA ligase
VRLFLAVDPDLPARTALERELITLRRHLTAWDPCVRWTHPDALHLTVRFLGEVSGQRLAGLTAALGSTLPLAPFQIQTKAAGTFASRGQVRTLWLAVGLGRDGLTSVHDEIAHRLRAAGWPDEERPFVPHLTIGRVRDRYGRKTAGLAEAVTALPLRSVAWRVDRVVLYSSDLSGRRPVYEAQHTMMLRGPA